MILNLVESNICHSINVTSSRCPTKLCLLSDIILKCYRSLFLHKSLRSCYKGLQKLTTNMQKCKTFLYIHNNEKISKTIAQPVWVSVELTPHWRKPCVAKIDGVPGSRTKFKKNRDWRTVRYFLQLCTLIYSGCRVKWY